MYQDPETPIRLPELPDGAGPIQPFPRSVVWSAGLIIVLLGVFGLYQGFHGAHSRGSGRGGDDEEGGAGVVSAQAAQPIPTNTQWSTLSGPAMSSAAPKAQSSAPAAANEDEDDNAADSEAPSPAPQTTAATSAPGQAQSSQAPQPGSVPPTPQPSPDQEKDQF